MIYCMKGCKGICDRLSSGKPFGNPFKTHALCKRCDAWMNLKLLLDNKCPCCKFKPKTKASHLLVN